MAKPKTKLKTNSKDNSAAVKDMGYGEDVLGESTDIPSDSEGTDIPSNVTYKRNMTGKKEVFTDLYKLSVAKVIKYEGWDEPNEHPDTHPNKFSTWEHTHPFRTYDKKGAKIFTSTPIGGHFHIVEWEDSPNKDEAPIIKSVSGPMVMAKKKVRGLFKMEPVPANEYDFHTHDVEYLRSSKIEVSTTNVEATRVMALVANKTAPIQGVTER